MRQGSVLCFLVIGFCLSSCAKEKEPISGWASFPVAIYSDAAVVASEQNRADFYEALAFWETRAGRKLFDYRGVYAGAAPYSGTVSQPQDILANVIFFQNPWPFSSSVAGQTTVISSKDEGIHGSIIMLNPNISRCAGDCTGESFRISQQKLIAHELGHFLGMAHTQDTADIMYPSMSPGGSLNESDTNRAALQAVVK